MAASSGDIDFNMVKTLGEGAFGKVYLVTDKHNPADQYAMKVINLSKSPEEERELALKEARLLSDFNHENILRYVESFEEDGALCIVTEFCDGGDLSQYLEARKNRPLKEDRIVEWFKQICCALSYLHGRKIIHRDMKTQNVFLTGTKKIAKLGDLGLAKVLERPNAKAVTFCGSPYYMSPELFACKPYDAKSDIWALGVCVYEMATLERPFDAMLMQQLVFKIVHGQIPPMPKDRYSPKMITVMEKMLCKESDKRPSADDLLNDPLFQNHTAPATPPTPSEKPKRQMNWFQATLTEKTGANDGRGAFNMDSLMSTLTETHKQRKQKFGKSIIASSQVDNKIMASNYGEKKFEKTCKDLSSFRKNTTLKASPSDMMLSSVTSEDMEETLAAVAKGQPNPAKMLQLVVRTLTQIFPKGLVGGDDEDKDSEGAFAFVGNDSNEMDPETMLLSQIAQLQRHCVRVMGDLKKFQKAYDMLSHTDDDMKLEEKLIKFLGPDVFGLCGVQLFYCKNFEYNLQKLRDGGRGVTDA